jgi:hypothetical protein
MLITLARKPPLKGGTVSQTCLLYGAGALNIDASRIATTDDFSNVQGFASMKLNARRQGESEEEWKVRVRSGPEQQAALAKLQTLGRWPSNVILSHAGACQQVGTKVVQSDGHHPASRGSGGLSTSGHGGQRGLTERGPKQEVVPAFACAPACAAAATGDPARFFKQVGTKPC